MRGNISFGDGVYKSIDAGKTWKHMGLPESYAIGTITVHPQNPDLVYAAALGKIWGPTPNKERGLFRSKDGGKSWEKILFVDDTTGCVDVKMDPANPAILYASMWKAWRTPYSLSSGGKGSGLYKSTDGGDTWKLLSENPGHAQRPQRQDHLHRIARSRQTSCGRSLKMNNTVCTSPKMAALPGAA